MSQKSDLQKIAENDGEVQKYIKLLEGAIDALPLPQYPIGNLPGAGRKSSRRIEGKTMAIILKRALDVPAHLGRYGGDIDMDELLTDVAGLYQALEHTNVTLIDKE